jgi:Mg2+-importing ATPase
MIFLMVVLSVSLICCVHAGGKFVISAASCCSSARSASLFQTGWFVESILSQTLIIHVLRTGRLAFIESRASLSLMITSGLVCLIGIALPYSPLATTLGFTPLPGSYWPMLGAMVIAYLTLTHAMKVWLNRRFELD